MLAVGSSLMIYSGYRFCEHAHRMGKPIADINLGHARADHHYRLKVERPCADVLVDFVPPSAAAFPGHERLLTRTFNGSNGSSASVRGK